MGKMKFKIEKGVLMHYRGTEKEVVIPEGTRVIAPKAFLGAAITAVHIPDTVREIAHHAFMGCKRLTEVLLPASVAKIGNHAFCNCTNLKKYKIAKTARPYQLIGRAVLHAFIGFHLAEVDSIVCPPAFRNLLSSY